MCDRQQYDDNMGPLYIGDRVVKRVRARALFAKYEYEKKTQEEVKKKKKLHTKVKSAATSQLNVSSSERSTNGQAKKMRRSRSNIEIKSCCVCSLVWICCALSCSAVLDYALCVCVWCECVFVCFFAMFNFGLKSIIRRSFMRRKTVSRFQFIRDDVWQSIGHHIHCLYMKTIQHRRNLFYHSPWWRSSFVTDQITDKLLVCTQQSKINVNLERNLVRIFVIVWFPLTSPLDPWDFKTEIKKKKWQIKLKMKHSIVAIIMVTMTVHAIWATPALTENQIIEDIKFLSQTSHGVKPSRLRALLVADLKKALTVTVCIFKLSFARREYHTSSPILTRVHIERFQGLVSIPNLNRFLIDSVLIVAACVCVCVWAAARGYILCVHVLVHSVGWSKMSINL